MKINREWTNDIDVARLLCIGTGLFVVASHAVWAWVIYLAAAIPFLVWARND